MKKVSIVSDSTSDLSKELLEKYQIDIIPLHVHLGEKEYRDGVDITPEEIYAWSDKNKSTPKTSAIAPLETRSFLEKHLAESEALICFCISEEMSTGVSVLNLEAEDLGASDRVFVINSASLSTGIGLQIIEAALMAEQGLDAKTIAEKILELRPKVRASFVVDTLTYLYRGGRCSGLAALAGSTLKLHPCILVEDGKMHPGKKYRGRMAKVVNDYVKDLNPQLQNAKKDRVFITHSGCDDELVESIKKQLEEMNYFDEILITRAGSVISSHCGPGTLGVLFIEN